MWLLRYVVQGDAGLGGLYSSFCLLRWLIALCDAGPGICDLAVSPHDPVTEPSVLNDRANTQATPSTLP